MLHFGMDYYLGLQLHKKIPVVFKLLGISRAQLFTCK
jgi:hypothetical protein